MGRKGVSKRKPSQNKSNSKASESAGNSVTSVVRAAESKPVNTFETGKDGHTTKGGAKSRSNRQKNHK